MSYIDYRTIIAKTTKNDYRKNYRDYRKNDYRKNL